MSSAPARAPDAPSLGGELKGLIRLGVPIAIAQSGDAVMGAVDTAIVGRVSAAALAGVGIGNLVFFTGVVALIGTLFGFDPLISQAHGAGERARTRSLLWQGLWLAFLFSLLLTPLLALAPLAFPLIGVDPEVAETGSRYLYWRLPSLLPLLMFNSVRAYLQALGRTAPLLWAMVIANLVNLPADLLLVFGGASLPEWTGPLRAVPAMGAAGAALASVICSLLQVAIVLLAASRFDRDVPVRRAPDRADLVKAARIGFPVGMHYLLEVGAFSISGLMVARLGAPALAAHQLGLTLGSLSFRMVTGIGSAGAVRVGWAVGSGRSETVLRAGQAALLAGLLIMGMAALVFFIFPEQVIRVMTDDPEVIAVAVPLMAVIATLQLADGLQGVGAGVLRGMGDTRLVFYVNLVAYYLIALPAAWLFSYGLDGGVRGVWWGLALGLTVVAIALSWRFFHKARGPIARL